MTGAEHYAEAERLVAEAGQAVNADADAARSAAQVHATLAHAAATAGEWVWPVGGVRASRQWIPALDPAKASTEDGAA